MFRPSSLLLLVIISLTLAGYVKSNDAIAQEVLSSIDSLTAAVEGGDKAKIQSAVNKLTTVIEENKNKKMLNSEKYMPQMEAAGKRLQDAMAKAVTTGKITQQELMAIGQTFSSAR